VNAIKSLIALWALTWSLSAVAAVSGLPDFTELVEKASPAVVNIRVTQYGQRARQGRGGDQQQQPFGDEDVPEFFRRFFGPPGNPGYGQPDRFGAGSGFIIEADGYIVTNHHVVDGADEIIVRMADRREFKADVVGTDELSDIALLKVDAEDLPTLKIGSSEKLKRGEWVMAIGSPFNFDQSVTAGIVSAKGRSNASQQYVPFIQSDVAINRGNSGGPLLNMEGEVVGVNSWILSSSGGYIGLSFSIPSDVAMRTVQELREHGSVRRGLLGVIVRPVDRELAEAMKLDRPVGALVNDVTDGGAAERAGIEPGDIILAFNDEKVETSDDLPPLVGAHPPGTKAKVLVSRAGQQREFNVVLDALNDDEATTLAAEDRSSGVSNMLGLAIENLDEQRRQDMEAPRGGVLITDVESDEAWRAGLRPGDVLLMINNREIRDVSDFEVIVGELKPDRAVALRVWRDGASTFFAYTPKGEDIG